MCVFICIGVFSSSTSWLSQKLEILFGSFLSADNSRVCYSSWHYSTSLRATVFCYVAYGRMGERQVTKKSREKALTIRSLQATTSKKFKSARSSLDHRSFYFVRLNRVLQLTWVDLYTGAFRRSPLQREIGACAPIFLQHVTTNKALPATVTKTVISVQWNNSVWKYSIKLFVIWLVQIKKPQRQRQGNQVGNAKKVVTKWLVWSLFIKCFILMLFHYNFINKNRSFELSLKSQQAWPRCWMQGWMKTRMSIVDFVRDCTVRVLYTWHQTG